ncbi:dihydrolipoyl dehydrogenase [Halobacterium bonnevillei]|uniref:Dihydrolipoyl dehydrogenase n=1 Tax=Halobacterium bonnevillei TaxID=2692200 RepID=A0A6B0SKB0_9EURY|nr:dihydrolipoyl dehydrogenase [Halobacterium bonnevillei]MXR20181.1 dihydrolipoyl dehydrogenase [Halobacterium bonnevillei]
MSETPSETDLLVVGSGPGGYVAAIRGAQCGLDTVLVERGELGGVCLNHGCIPSKALIEVARHASGDDATTAMGLTGRTDVDYGEFTDWQDGVVNRLTSGVASLCRSNGVTIVEGTASFVDDHSVSIDPPGATADPETVAFEHAIVATGSRPLSIPGFDFDDDPVLSSRDVLDLPEPPDRLVVVGAGYIGMELSTAFAKLGTDVQVVEALDGPLPGYPDDIVGVVQDRCEDLGVNFSFGEAASEWYQDITGDVTVVAETDDGERHEYAAEYVLVAVGREPVTDVVDLDATSVETDEGGFVATDEYGRTDAEHVYAIGDVAGEPMLAHAASHEGMRAAEHAAGREVEGGEHPIPAVVFTDPEIASVGLSAADAESADRDVVVGKVPFRSNGRALTTGDAAGFARVVVDSDDGTVLGGELVGPHVSEVLGELTLAVTAGLDVGTLAGTVHAHPTLSECLMEAAAQTRGEAIHAPNR